MLDNFADKLQPLKFEKFLKWWCSSAAFVNIPTILFLNAANVFDDTNSIKLAIIIYLFIGFNKQAGYFFASSTDSSIKYNVSVTVNYTSIIIVYQYQI